MARGGVIQRHDDKLAAVRLTLDLKIVIDETQLLHLFRSHAAIFEVALNSRIFQNTMNLQSMLRGLGKPQMVIQPLQTFHGEVVPIRHVLNQKLFSPHLPSVRHAQCCHERPDQHAVQQTPLRWTNTIRRRRVGRMWKDRACSCKFPRVTYMSFPGSTRM